MNNKQGKVYVVHHIDTEGPLYESLEALFERLNNVFEIQLEPSLKNLSLIKTNKLSFGQEKDLEIKQFLDSHLSNYIDNWHDLEQMINKVSSPNFRNKFKDSNVKGWVFNWHVMDHVGFSNDNPRRRTYGFNSIYNFYEKLVQNQDPKIDSLHWHFHPISFSKSAHIPATSYDNSMKILHEIISRRLIDKNNFPVVNRAGFHTVRFDSNLFLEQWMPFDASNQAIKEQPKFQKDLINGRYGDWRGAPDDWSIYNPSFNDWRKSGNLKRSISRVLNLKARHREITKQEIEIAFKRAKEGENVYLGVTNHDWRDMHPELLHFRSLLSKVSAKFKNIDFIHSEAVDAFRGCLNFDETMISQDKIDLSIELNNNIIQVDIINGEIFGPQPYLAIKTKEGKYLHDNFDFGIKEKQFLYTFDEYTIPLEQISKLTVASNDKYGNTCIKKLKLN